jgi:hypothetical protein
VLKSRARAAHPAVVSGYRRSHQRLLMITVPFVVSARTVAPPPFSGTDNRRLIRPCTVIGISVLIRPFTVPVSRLAA